MEATALLKAVSLEVRQGEIVCLIGANGAGKTTLLNCLSGVHPNRSGNILFYEQGRLQGSIARTRPSRNRPGP